MSGGPVARAQLLPCEAMSAAAIDEGSTDCARGFRAHVGPSNSSRSLVDGVVCDSAKRAQGRRWTTS